MDLTLLLSLVGVAIIPIIVVTFLPRNRSFFENSLVKGFGLGVYLMLVVVLLMEAVEESSTVTGLMWFGVGLIFSFLLGVILKEFHHHHSSEESHDQASTYRILTSDFFHNMVDGLAIITGFAVSPVVGGISFLGVLGHQIIQQVGQHILLVEGGVRVLKAISISLLISLSIFLGFLLEGGEWEAILLSLSAGIVAWKVWTDLLHTSWDRKTITGFVAGALILAIILLSIPHQH